MAAEGQDQDWPCMCSSPPRGIRDDGRQPYRTGRMVVGADIRLERSVNHWPSKRSRRAHRSCWSIGGKKFFFGFEDTGEAGDDLDGMPGRRTSHRNSCLPGWQRSWDVSTQRPPVVLCWMSRWRGLVRPVHPVNSKDPARCS